MAAELDSACREPSQPCSLPLKGSRRANRTNFPSGFQASYSSTSSSGTLHIFSSPPVSAPILYCPASPEQVVGFTLTAQALAAMGQCRRGLALGPRWEQESPPLKCEGRPGEAWLVPGASLNHVSQLGTLQCSTPPLRWHRPSTPASGLRVCTPLPRHPSMPLVPLLADQHLGATVEPHSPQASQILACRPPAPAGTPSGAPRHASFLPLIYGIGDSTLLASLVPRGAQGQFFAQNVRGCRRICRCRPEPTGEGSACVGYPQRDSAVPLCFAKAAPQASHCC